MTFFSTSFGAASSDASFSNGSQSAYSANGGLQKYAGVYTAQAINLGAQSEQLKLSQAQYPDPSLTGQGEKATRVRWRQNRMPLMIGVFPPDEPESSISMTLGELDALIREAFTAWRNVSTGAASTRSNNPLRPQLDFRYCYPFVGVLPSSGEQKPDILIQWTSDTVLGREYETGHTRRELEPDESALNAAAQTSPVRYIAHVEITLVTQPKIDHRLSSHERRMRLYATLLHEIGHALGLEHGLAKQDVMHHRGWRNVELSDGDIRAFESIYRQRQRLG